MLRNRLIVIGHDLLMISIAWYGAFWLRFNLEHIPPVFLHEANFVLPWIILIQAVAYKAFGLYRGVWRFASLPDLMRIVKAVIVAAGCAALGLFFYTRMQLIPRSIFPLYSFLLIGLLSGSRLTFRWLIDYSGLFSRAESVLIVGAGAASEAVIRELLRDPKQRYRPVVLVDDDASKKGQDIHGIRVRGDSKQIPKFAARFNIKLIILAIPSISAQRMREIVLLCEQAKVPYRTLPGLVEIAAGNISINQLREVSLEDLLGREQVTLEWEKISAEHTGKNILVTGGGGSIGAELCRQIAKLKPAALIIVEMNEYNLYSIDYELREQFPELTLFAYLTDILDVVALTKIMQQHQPDILFHAAAYKHVPLLEAQIRVAVRNNIIGTKTVADIAVANGVKKFVLISSDKAVNPTNIMGATKRAAEVLCQNYNAHSQTHFITVRFGNVLGSAGSVVPLFRKQLAAGGPLTVTHPEVIRFFMTIPEATLLILQATTMGKGGEIFVLDMGEPVKISYLAEQMIRLSGKQPGKDIEIIYTGLRPGEKLFEELFYESETLIKTAHHKILQAQYLTWDWQQLSEYLHTAAAACERNSLMELNGLLKKLVPEYQ